MQHINDDDKGVDDLADGALVDPIPAADHIGSHVENPVENPPAEATERPRRVLVIGSHGWTWTETIARAALDWWVANDRPPTRLITDSRGDFPVTLHGVIDQTKFPIEMHSPVVEGRNPERKLKRIMTVDGIDHVLIFRLGQDAFVEDWVTYLQEQHDSGHTVTATIVTVERVAE